MTIKTKRAFQTKMFLVTALVLFVGASVAGAFYFSLNKFKNIAMDSIAAGGASEIVAKLRLSNNDLRDTVKELKAGLAAVGPDDYEMAYDDLKSQYTNLIAQIDAVPGWQDESKKIADAWAPTNEKMKALLDAIKGGKPAPEKFDEIRDGMKASLSAVNAFDDIADAKVALVKDAAIDVDSKGKSYLLFAIVGFTLAAIAGWAVTRSLAREFTSLRNQLVQVAEALSNRSQNLEEQASKVSASATQGAAAVQETVSTLDEIKSMTSRSMDKVSTSSQVAETCLNIAQKLVKQCGTPSMRWMKLREAMTHFSKKLKITTSASTKSPRSSMRSIVKQMSSTTLFFKPSYFHLMPLSRRRALANKAKDLL